MKHIPLKYSATCKTDFCNKPYYARGLCRNHYRKLLGKEGGYVRAYEKVKDRPEYKKSKSESDKRYRARLKEQGVLSKRQSEYYRKYVSNPENAQKKKDQAKAYYERTKEERREIAAAFTRRYRDGLKDKVLKHYSNDELKCNNCGIDVYSVLTLDHINNDGADHKRKLSKSGKASSSRIYKDLVDRNYPEGYQVLCFNCNYHKEFMKRCL